MPVVAVPALIPLSQHWTHQRVCSEVRTGLNELDNERVWDLTLRHHVNLALSSVVELLNKSNAPLYGEVWDCRLDFAPAVRTGLPNEITLAAYIGRLWKVKSLYVQWYGNCVEVPLEKLTGLTTDLNTQWEKSIAWCHQGTRLLVHVGRKLVPPTPEFDAGGLALPDEYPITTTTAFRLYVHRNPALDDYSEGAEGWTRFIDCPDRHVRLVTVLAQKMVLEQLGKDIPVTIEQTIGQLTQLIEGGALDERE